ncbi:MAG: hypothetical protein Q9192_007965, partial [Flavoplaca navasiana]
NRVYPASIVLVGIRSLPITATMPPKRTRTVATNSRKKSKTAGPEDVGEVEETTLVNDGDGFQSQIFTILAGRQRHKFTAHASFLSQSPVLDRMCHGPFEESLIFTIHLPDENPDTLQAKFGSVNETGCTIRALLKLAELYGVAEKYQLQGLKALVIKKLEGSIDVDARPFEFLMAARKIYNCIPDSDKEFFKKASTKLPPPKLMPQVLRHQYNDQLEEGGVMAVDMVAALCVEYTARIDQMKLKANDDIVRMRTENRELAKDKARYKKYYEQLRNGQMT